MLSLILDGMVPVYAVTPAGEAFYVSPNGSDVVNNGTSPSAPFLSLERARSAMQESRSAKTVFLMGGIYDCSNTLTLGKADSGETWQAYSRQIPVLDGGGKVATGIKIDGATNVTIRWLTLRNFQQIGIHANNATGFILDSDTIEHITSTHWNQSAVEVSGSCRDGRITHNHIENCGYCGIEVNAVPGDDLTGLAIEFNVVYDTMKTVKDGGGIYLMDRGHSESPVRIANNIIGNYGNQKNKSKAIYLDDGLSHATVMNNVVWGTGSYCVQFHGGDHDIITNNIFDITEVSKLGYYQDGSPGKNYGMAGNCFANNIVYSLAKKTPSALWSFLNESPSPILKPIVRENTYWTPHATLPNIGSIVDSKPNNQNPSFVDPAKHNYQFQSASPIGFAVFDSSKVGPLSDNR